MSFGAVCKQWKDRYSECGEGHAYHFCHRWYCGCIQALASTLFKGMCAVLLLMTALGSLSVMSLGALFLIFSPATVIAGIMGALAIDNKLKLIFFP
jgi:hypothetical protein